jgi:hypothetical protein
MWLLPHVAGGVMAHLIHVANQSGSEFSTGVVEFSTRADAGWLL